MKKRRAITVVIKGRRSISSLRGCGSLEGETTVPVLASKRNGMRSVLASEGLLKDTVCL